MARYPSAVWAPGPLDKQGYAGLAVNACRGVVCHSMVGRFDAAFSRLDGSDRASWHFSVTKDGMVYQHYDSKAVTWHAGTMKANGLYIGIEHEGGPIGNESEPLTPAQREASVALVRWLSLEHGFPLVRKVALWEHNELYATSCPSYRIPWAEYAEEHMASIEYDELKARDEDIKRALAIIAARHKAAIDFLSLTAVNLAGQVYGDDDPKTLDLKQRVDALAAELAGA